MVVVSSVTGGIQMEANKRGKNKIGARCLSRQEAIKILPTYEQIEEQVEQFSREREGTDQEKNQKTNNIGIIGVRGAGKTSLLKTIRSELEERNQRDVILPLIVPENMSDSSTLMATILGMLSKFVEQRAKEEEKREKERYRNRDCVKGTGIKEIYNEVVKKYTFIQNEYRSLLIQGYTTENDYVRSSAKVLNSDVEFIDSFHELIDQLVKEEKTENEDKRPMVFVFVDDIDLSTRRCTDVVKTLLSYLSNENIVTFLSGDLETFEEALTLDFLRQEEALDKDVLEKSMLANEKKEDFLLNRKNRLAYEYLKKILPPVYRHNIKEWSLEEKGSYSIQGADAAEGSDVKKGEDTQTGTDTGKRAEGKTLSQLLSEVLKDWVDASFFEYHDVTTENIDHNGNEERREKKEVLPYTYHIFDNTSRGLNNVYNVLNEIAEEKNREEKKEESREDRAKRIISQKKRLLDTMIASKPVYNQYRNEIQRRMFYLGTEDGGKVFFDNANAIIYEGAGESGKGGLIEEAEDRFALFLLVDFMARVLYEAEYEEKVREDDAYRALKKNAMKDLFFHPSIAEKVRAIKSGQKGWECYDENKKVDDMTLYDVNMSFLLKGDLAFNLAYYKNLSLDRIQELCDNMDRRLSVQKNKAEEMKDPVELEQHFIIAFWKAFLSVESVDRIREKAKEQEHAVDYYSVFWREFQYIQGRLSSQPIQNQVRRLFDMVWEREIKRDSKPESQSGKKLSLRQTIGDLGEEQEPKVDGITKLSEWIKNIVLNTMASYIQEIDGKMRREETRKEILQQFLQVEEKDRKRRREIIIAIDAGRLWREEAAENVVGYLEEEIDRLLTEVVGNLSAHGEGRWKLNMDCAKKSLNEFRGAKDGVTYTKAKVAKAQIETKLYHAGESFEKGISLSMLWNILTVLWALINSHARYGRYEALNLVNHLQEVYAEPDDRKGEQEPDLQQKEKICEYQFLVWYYYRYRKETGDGEKIEEEARLLAEITKRLSDANKEADSYVLSTFLDKLSHSLAENHQNGLIENGKIDREEFENLFGR